MSLFLNPCPLPSALSSLPPLIISPRLDLTHPPTSRFPAHVLFRAWRGCDQLRSSWNKAVPLPEPHTPSAATEPEIRRAPGPGPKEFKDESAQTQSDNSTLEQRLAELDKERQVARTLVGSACERLERGRKF
eukprot:912028-Rhodomonas_salina.8